MTTTLAHEAPLSLQESALATAMAHHIGDATVRFAMSANGTRYHDVSLMNTDEFGVLVRQFQTDPKEALAWGRESLLAINQDDRLNSAERKNRLSRYLDAYSDLTIRLDHEAFPPTASGEVREGVPEYIPDGFVDMGGNKSANTLTRTREMIVVNKQSILEKYKPVLMDIFSRDYSQDTSDSKKAKMTAALAEAVYYRLPYDYSQKDLGGGRVDLGDMADGVCRHQALTFQVLAQAAGLTSRVVKNYMTSSDGRSEKHAANMVRINNKWFLFDVTNPDTIEKNNQKFWRPGVIPIDRPPQSRERRTYSGTYKHSGVSYQWAAHDNMYWMIDEPA